MWCIFPCIIQITFKCQNSVLKSQNFVFKCQNSIFKCRQNFVFKWQNSIFKCQNFVFKCQNSLLKCQNSVFKCQNSLFKCCQNLRALTNFCTISGILDYCEKYGGNIEKICEEQGESRQLHGSNTAQVVHDVMCNASVPVEKLEERRTWRDKRLAALAVHQAGQED